MLSSSHRHYRFVYIINIALTYIIVSSIYFILYIYYFHHSWKYDVNITRIESRPVSQSRFDFFVDFHGRVGDRNVNKLLQNLKGMTDKLLVLDEKEVRVYL